jgi:hypothetical protein
MSPGQGKETTVSAFRFLGMGLLLITGCSSDAPPARTVTGEVTLDNQPLAEGNIQFRPIAGDATTAGAPIKDGKFTAELPLAKMRVEITASKVVGQRKAYDAPNSPVVDEVVELIPRRYNSQSELTLDVQSTTETARFDLKSK